LSEDRRGILGILANAIDMELEGKTFFAEVAEKAKNARTRDTFNSLVKQEQRHVDILGAELKRLEGGMGWASLENMRASAPSYPKISVFQDKELKRLKFDPGSGELEALEVGIDVEKKSIEYYRSAANQSSDPKAREVFNWLVGEEAGHLTILTSEHEYRTNSGFYYDNAEFSLEVM
jgi:rubrerythrin